MWQKRKRSKNSLTVFQNHFHVILPKLFYYHGLLIISQKFSKNVLRIYLITKHDKNAFLNIIFDNVSQKIFTSFNQSTYFSANFETTFVNIHFSAAESIMQNDIIQLIISQSHCEKARQNDFSAIITKNL